MKKIIIVSPTLSQHESVHVRVATSLNFGDEVTL